MPAHAAGRPDLVVTKLTAPAGGVRPGTRHNAHAVLSNLGSSTAGRSVAGFYLSPARGGVPRDIRLGRVSTVALAPGRGARISLPVHGADLDPVRQLSPARVRRRTRTDSRATRGERLPRVEVALERAPRGRSGRGRTRARGHRVRSARRACRARVGFARLAHRRLLRDELDALVRGLRCHILVREPRRLQRDVGRGVTRRDDAGASRDRRIVGRCRRPARSPTALLHGAG